jgi:hypothetical protein
MEWIKVNDRLPNNIDYVLFCDWTGDMIIGYVSDNNCICLSDDSFADIKDFSHWMPLPKQPEQ